MEIQKTVGIKNIIFYYTSPFDEKAERHIGRFLKKFGETLPLGIKEKLAFDGELSSYYDFFYVSRFYHQGKYCVLHIKDSEWYSKKWEFQPARLPALVTFPNTLNVLFIPKKFHIAEHIKNSTIHYLMRGRSKEDIKEFLAFYFKNVVY